MEFNYIKTFKQLSKNDNLIAGGKAASLGEMTQAGFPVPDGFVILTSAFNEFLTDTNLAKEIDGILKIVRPKKIDTIYSASERIKALILNFSIPLPIKKEIEKAFGELNAKYVAVRSSATAEDGADEAWAGQLESYLNTSKDELIDNVKNCWASLFTPRAIAYRFEKKLSKNKIAVGVVVQKMIDSEISGVAFSVHPVTRNHDQLIIEGIYGLGEAMVSGQITPNSYVVNKESLRIIEKKVFRQSNGIYRNKNGVNEWRVIAKNKANRSVLSNNKVKELAKLVLEIEEHYEFPCDIEWAVSKNKIQILQSRPITTLPAASTSAEFENITTANYTYFCHLNGIGYSSPEQMLRGYDCFDFLVISYRNTCYWYIPTAQLKSRLSEGYNLLKNGKKFERYLGEFKNILQRIETLGKNIKKKKISAETWMEFDDLLKNFFNYYKYTEWFYTDWIYMRSGIPAERIKQMETMKNIARNGANEFYLGKHSPCDLLFHWVSKKLKCSTQDLDYSTAADVANALRGGKLKTNLNRKKGYVIWLKKGKQEEYDEKTAIKLLKKLKVIKKEKSTQELTGICAMPGTITAKATVIPMLYGDLKKMQKLMNAMPQGNILVASTTSPELTPIFKKASAIVTDEGGLGSHAAIVSRELGIPCIVGTVKATHVIRNGMLIEVDAANGRVRILKK